MDEGAKAVESVRFTPVGLVLVTEIGNDRLCMEVESFALDVIVAPGEADPDATSPVALATARGCRTRCAFAANAFRDITAKKTRYINKWFVIFFILFVKRNNS